MSNQGLEDGNTNIVISNQNTVIRKDTHSMETQDSIIKTENQSAH